MNEMLDQYWHYLMAAFAGLVWFIRLEGRVTANKDELDRQRQQRDEDLRAANASRLEVHNMLAEMRADIKALLRADK